FGNPAGWAGPGWCPPPAGCGCHGVGVVEQRGEPHRSSVRPAPDEPELLRTDGKRKQGRGPVRVGVLDTGFAADVEGGSLVAGLTATSGGTARVSARDPEPWGPTKPGYTTTNRDGHDEDGDRWLDPVAGHGTFIASLIARFARDIDVRV